MRNWLIHAGIAVALASGAPILAQAPSAPALNLSFDAEGRVTLIAQNVTVRDILVEWSRQCGCHIVNAEKLLDGPLTLPIQFENAAQSTVLESLLRDAAGYVLTPRRAGVQSASNYETIYILATSHPVDNSFGLPYVADVPLPPATRGAPDDEIPPVMPLEPGPAPAGPVAPSPSAPFGSRTSSPNVFSTPVRSPQSSTPPTAPGAVTPSPQVPPGTSTPYPSSTPPSGVPVQIIPLPPSGQ